jgi:hypothetical protein
MRDAAAFAARRFDQMSLAPEDFATVSPVEHPVFTRLDLALERAAVTEREGRDDADGDRAAWPLAANGPVSTSMFQLDPA